MEDGALSEPEDGSWPPARRALRLGEDTEDWALAEPEDGSWDMEDGARSTIFDLLSSILHLPSTLLRLSPHAASCWR